MHWTCCLSSRP
uniref:Uncharacterized protein n=1 Tax=Rhizophora mucronata TaxID=61149 RepID=A0A2P2PHG3_RHIMU